MRQKHVPRIDAAGEEHRRPVGRTPPGLPKPLGRLDGDGAARRTEELAQERDRASEPPGETGTDGSLDRDASLPETHRGQGAGCEESLRRRLHVVRAVRVRLEAENDGLPGGILPGDSGRGSDDGGIALERNVRDLHGGGSLPGVFA